MIKYFLVRSMNETIGAKGGHRDRKRSMIIERSKKQKLQEYQEQEEIRELEKKVKKQQAFTLIKTLPIVIGGGTIRNMREVANPKPDKEDVNSRWRIKEYDADVTHKTPYEDYIDRERKVITLPTGTKVVIYIPVVTNEKATTKDQKVDSIPNVEPTTEVKKVEGISEEKKDSKKKEEEKRFVFSTEETKKEQKTSPSISTGVSTPVGVGEVVSPQEIGKEQENLVITPYVERTLDFQDIDFENLPDSLKDKLQTLKSRKIISELEKQLKDVRYELRKIISDYNVLVDEEKRVVLSKEAEVMLDKLSDIITKIEKLKAKIQIDHLEDYDDNYLYTLVEEYLNEFRDGHLVDEIKDSPLYVLISNKLEELEEKRDILDKEVNDKKDELEKKEQRFDELKKSYYSIDQLNEDLFRFQRDQELFLRDVREKINQSVTETERVRVQFEGMTRPARRMMRMLAFQMFLPGPRFARGLAASSAAYLYFMNQIMHPNLVEQRYRVITVKDYSREIENSLLEIDDAVRLLDKTSSQIDRMIREINEKYKDYFDVVPECREMINNLYRIQNDVKEKEYEMEQLKKQQELELERNNAKVKTIGEYPVN